MNRASLGDFKQAHLLLVGELPRQMYVSFDLCDAALLRRTVRAIFCVNALVMKADFDFLKRPSFAIRVKLQCHSGACAQARE
jgi:hypothetical protein